MKTLKEFTANGRRVLVRCDFNVPTDNKGKILDDFKIRQSIPTIKYLIEQGAKVILMSHLDPESTGVADRKYTMDNVGERLSEHLRMSIKKVNDSIGPEVDAQTRTLDDGEVLLLENLKFYKEEEDGDEEFAKKLSYLGDFYVNDAFGTCHRNYASIVGVPKNIPYCAGLLLEKEVKILGSFLRESEKPVVAIVGGKKVETKAKFIEKLLETTDFVLVSGLIAKEIEEKDIKFAFPQKIIVPLGQLDAPDINEESVKIFEEKIMQAKTVLWNGPFGKFEEEKYSAGTLAIAKAIINSKAFSVVGGGETVEFLEKNGIIDKFSHVSTGGGAMLNYLSGDKLPGIEALE
jgi:phosphoglycerate kinase